MVSLNAAQQGLANRPHLDLLRQWRFSRGGAAKSSGAREDAGCRPTPPCQLPPGPAPTGAGWLPGNAICPIVHLHGCQATGTEL